MIAQELEIKWSAENESVFTVLLSTCHKRFTCLAIIDRVENIVAELFILSLTAFFFFFFFPVNQCGKIITESNLSKKKEC